MLPAGGVYRKFLMKFKILLGTKVLDYLFRPLERTKPRKVAFVLEKSPSITIFTEAWLRDMQGAGSSRARQQPLSTKEPREAYVGSVFLIVPCPAKRTRPSWEMAGKAKRTI